MTITLHPDQVAWLQARVANGDFASVEAAARQLIGERIAEMSLGEEDALGDMGWAKSYIDAGLAELDRGEGVSLEDLKAQNAALLASLKP